MVKKWDKMLLRFKINPARQQIPTLTVGLWPSHKIITTRFKHFDSWKQEKILLEKLLDSANTQKAIALPKIALSFRNEVEYCTF